MVFGPCEPEVKISKLSPVSLVAITNFFAAGDDETAVEGDDGLGVEGDVVVEAAVGGAEVLGADVVGDV